MAGEPRARSGTAGDTMGATLRAASAATDRDDGTGAGMKDDEVAALRAAGVRIPPCPQVVADLQQVLREPDSRNQAVSCLIGRDIKLASVVFRTANSAACAPGRRKFATLDEAVTVLGRRTIANIVRVAALQLSLGGPDPRLARFWERSMDVAMLCSIVAEKAPNPGALSPEQAFTAGLFHDCGVAVLIQHFDSYCRALADPRMPLPDILGEDRRFGTSHCLVGRMVAREWDLPALVAGTIGFHHDPLAGVPEAGIAASAALMMSTHIANVRAGAGDGEWAGQQEAVLARLGLENCALAAFERDVWDAFQVLH